MLFAIGYVAGLVTALIVVFAISVFRKPIESNLIKWDGKSREIAKKIKVEPTGFIYMPPDDAEEARQEIIERNQREGRDTKISELS